MKSDQPAPGTAKRPPSLKSSSVPVGETTKELHAQVLALRALVEVLIERDPSIKTTIVREGNSILQSIIKTSDAPVAPEVLNRAKRVLLWTNSRKT